MATKKKMLQAAAGSATGGAGEPGLDITDVFSTYLYEGNGGSQIINNGIALGDSPDDGVYYLSSPSSLTGNNSALSSVSATVDGTITLNSSTTKFAANSYSFDGASNLRLSSALIDTSSSFCFETWVYFDSTGHSGDMAMLLAQYKSGEDGRLLFGAQNGDLVVRYNGSSVAITAPVSASQWHHVAWSYDGTTHRLFVDGTLEDSTTLDFPIYTGVTTQIGGTDPTLLSGYDLDGNMEDIRITTGDARYTASFTPPTASHPVTTAVTAGEGGLVWLKQRSAVNNHVLFDTERGNSVALSSNNTGANNGPYTNFGVTSYNSSGFSLGSRYASEINNSGQTYASWTFRKAPKFFDCITWTGDGTSNRAIPHNLGGAVGSYFVKCTSHGTASDWIVWHKDLSSNAHNLVLNTTAAVDNNNLFSTTAPDSSNVYLGTANLDYFNATGRTYVAYLFAHNDGDGEFGPDGDQDIIKCGSFSHTSGTPTFVDCGFEAAWVMVKEIDGADSWWMADSMRGLTVNGINSEWAAANLTSTGASDWIGPNAQGFDFNYQSASYIYMAIRRGPLAPPESGTEVFAIATRDATAPAFNSGFPVDAVLFRSNISSAANNEIGSRLTGAVNLETNSTDAEQASSKFTFDYMDGYSHLVGNLSTRYSWMWKRAPNFFDAVAYSGNSTAGRTVSHNLGVAPEMMWVKARGGSEPWHVYHASLGASYDLRLNSTGAAIGGAWNSTEPTSTEFTLASYGGVNNSSLDYIAYLFASLPGISKVGSYTGNGSSQTIDCGFTSGARFILIKKSSGTGSWVVHDAERGIVSGNDPTLLLNSTSTEITTIDPVDPDSTGFIVNTFGDWNSSGQTYIFYAIA